MNRTCLFLFPHQLFEQLVSEKARDVVLVAEELFFSQFKFHPQKLLLHRLSMQAFSHRLRREGWNVAEWQESDGDLKSLTAKMAKQGVTAIEIFDPADDWILQRVTTCCAEAQLSLNVLESPSFLTSGPELTALHDKGDEKFMPFYLQQRKRLNVLVDSSGHPAGGRWSFDEDNRKKLGKGISVPSPPWSTSAECLYPTTHTQAREWLEAFLRQRFSNFGPYEDAIESQHPVLFHSVLSSSLNIGLLTPGEVLVRTLSYAREHDIPIATVEGFIRQLIGWREYIRMTYVFAGRKQRTKNFMRATRSLSEAFWTGETGLVPFDTVVRRVLNTAYCHHIERLMICGNLMFLCEINPDEVYAWFMSLFIDAYDWVMVPNVYGMSQFADGGAMMTKPYICGSNYILKMSNFKKGEWCDIWDGLYWRFVDRNREILSANYRTKFSVQLFDKMQPERKELLRNSAEKFLEQIF